MQGQDQIGTDRDVRDVSVHLTAEEAYPAMERAFLEARREIWAGFRVFDLFTKLRSDEAKAVGETWFDLIAHVLDRGVALNFVLSDFDPIAAPELHAYSWDARRAFIAAAESVGPKARLSVVNATHSARVGWLPRLVLWPRVVKELSKVASDLNAMSESERARRLEISPGLHRWLHRNGRVEVAARKWPPPPLVPATHHQKIVVFDRELLCQGGLDLDERRYDDKGHHRRRDRTWHDVQMFCRGPVVDEAQTHLERFLDQVAGSEAPPPARKFLRTVSRRRRFELPHLGPRGVVQEIAEAHRRMIGAARSLIYLETQYFRDRTVADALARAAARNPDLGLILILPGAPEVVAFDHETSSDARFGEYLQSKCIDTVLEAFGDRAAICSPVRPLRSDSTGRDALCGAPIIYVHAKVSIFDRDRAILSSANLNGRSLSWDTEVGVELEDPAVVGDLRERVMRHWLDEDDDAGFLDPGTAVARWRARAAENALTDPEQRKGFLVPYDPQPPRDFGRWLPGVPEAMV